VSLCSSAVPETPKTVLFLSYIPTFTEIFLHKFAVENCHARYQTVGTAVNNLNLYSVGTQFKFISHPDKVSHYEFHLLHDNSGTTLHNTNNTLLCEIFGFYSNVPKDSGFLDCGILCHSVSGSRRFEEIMCLRL